MALPKVVLFIAANEDSMALFREAVGIINPAIVRLQAANCQEAVAGVSGADALQPHLVFFDHRSEPDGTSWLPTLRQIKKRSGSALAIFADPLSMDDQKKFASAGVDFYLLKPKTLVQMVGVVKHVFARYHERKEKLSTAQQLVG